MNDEPRNDDPVADPEPLQSSHLLIDEGSGADDVADDVIAGDQEIDDYFAVDSEAFDEAPPKRARARWTYDWSYLGRLARVGWPVVAVAWIGWQFIRYGFVPTEEGLSYAQGYRILHGEIPHADFISNKLAGSALLHLPELLLAKLPGINLLPLARIVGIAEVMAISILIGRLVFGKRMRDWSPLQSLLVFTSALLNLHQMPFTATASVDGLLFALLGLTVLRSAASHGNRRRQIHGALLLGVAILMRLGFLWTIPVAVALLWHARRNNQIPGGVGDEAEVDYETEVETDLSDNDPASADWVDWVDEADPADTLTDAAVDDAANDELVVDEATFEESPSKERPRPGILAPGAFAFWALLPSLAYLALLLPLGALDDAGRQLWKAPWLWGTRFWFEFGPIDRPRLLQFILVLAGLVVASSWIQRWRAARPVEEGVASQWGATAADFAVRALGTYLIVRYLIEQGLEPKGIPPLGLTWVALLIGLLAYAYRGSFDKVALTIAALSWMSSMAFDYPYPGFVGGSLALLLVWRWWHGFTWPIDLAPTSSRQARLERVGLGLGGAAAVATLAPTWPHLGGLLAVVVAIFVFSKWHPESDLAPSAESAPDLLDADLLEADTLADIDADFYAPDEPAEMYADEVSAIKIAHDEAALAGRLRVAVAAMTLLAIGICFWTFRTARMSFPYLDVSWATQVGQLRDHDADFGGVRTNAMTYEAIGDLKECRKKYPAKWVFVGPENAFLYPLLEMRNPLPLDLMTPAEFKGQEKQLVEMATKRAKDKGLLLLAQYSPNKDLETQTKLPEATPGGANIMDSAGPPTQDIWKAFPADTGNLIACGPFSGKYVK